MSHHGCFVLHAQHVLEALLVDEPDWPADDPEAAPWTFPGIEDIAIERASDAASSQVTYFFRPGQATAATRGSSCQCRCRVAIEG